MILDLSASLADELTATLESTISDMSSEIAGTDNPAYRRLLDGRRKRLRAVQAKLQGVSVP
jgi:hypothetical protein